MASAGIVVVDRQHGRTAGQRPRKLQAIAFGMAAITVVPGGEAADRGSARPGGVHRLDVGPEHELKE